MMKNLKQTVGLRFELIRELTSFLWKQKLWWMLPMIVTLLLVGALIVFAQTTPLAPFVYTLF